jgi:hypothetical protein
MIILEPESSLASGGLGLDSLPACGLGVNVPCGLDRGSRFCLEFGVGVGRPVCVLGIEVSLITALELAKHNPIIESVKTPMRLRPKTRNLRFIFSTNPSFRAING